MPRARPILIGTCPILNRIVAGFVLGSSHNWLYTYKEERYLHIFK